jgi:hypothetical protein
MALEPDLKVPVGVLASPAIPEVKKEFHVLWALIQESSRLRAAQDTKNTDQKSAMLRVEIGKLARQLETAQHEMNAEERRILTDGLAALPDNTN